MSAYASVTDIIPCPSTGGGPHDWLDARQCSDQLYSGECSWCAALLIQHWWGWEFYTGEEHFDHEAWSFEEIRRITRPRLRVDEYLERVPMRFDPIPRQIGPNTRAIYHPQDLGYPEDLPLARVVGGENWGIYQYPNPPAAVGVRGNPGQYAQAFIRGIQAHRVQVAAERAVEDVLDARVNVGPDWNGIEIRNEQGDLV